MKFNYSILFIALLVIGCNQKADESYLRSEENINQDWSYLEFAAEDVNATKAQTGWSAIDLPYRRLYRI